MELRKKKANWPDKITKKYLLLLGLLGFIPGRVFAQGHGIENPIQADTIQELVHVILNAVVQIGSVVLVVMVVYTGFLIVKARGKEDEITKAKNAFLWTVIGAAIVLGAFVISEVIQATVRQL